MTVKGIIRNFVAVYGFLIVAFMQLHSQEKIEGLFYYDSRPVSVEIREGKISQVTRLNDVPDDFPKVYVGPGLIDNQVNGFAGTTFALGSDGGLTAEEVKKATRMLWQYGVTTYMPTFTTNSRELLIKNLSVLAMAKDDPELMGSIAGFHMEGPYISPVDGYRGAHPAEFVRPPDWNEFMEFYEASGRNIVQVTVAPETEGALEFITKCGLKSIIVALGHHNAPAEVVTAAVDRGARIVTHFGNGAANMIHRHRNPFWSQLADDRLMISIICDGFHLLPEEIRTFYKVKGAEKTIITSDVTSYGSLPPGNYIAGDGDSIKITDEGMLWNIAQGGLYGSATPITKGVGHIMEVTGCSLGEALQMASTNPAGLYALDDRGRLEPGKRADIILFTLENSQVKIIKTWVKGKLVYEAKK